MDRILLTVSRVSVGFSLFFLTLYLVVSWIRPSVGADAPMLSSSDVLWIGGLFVGVGLVALVAHAVMTMVSRHRARETAVARLEESTQS